MQDASGRTRGAAEQGSSSEASSGIPWSRGLLLLAVVGPALWLGGVKPWVVPCFAVVVAGLLVRRCLRSEGRLRVPALWWLGLLVSGVTLLQWLPLPLGVLRLLAPGLSEVVAEVSAGTELGAWNRLSVHPGQTSLEFARVLALTGLFIACAQLSWRLVAGCVALCGSLVAVIGLAHKLAGATAIYGVYMPRQALSGLGQELGSALLTSFVNANHQSGLLLIGVFAAASLAVDLSERARQTHDRSSSQRLADRAYVAWGALAIQATALVLSMSRAALLAALIVAPLALALGLNRPERGDYEPARGRRRKLALAALILLMVVLAASQGAWSQLESLRDPASFRAKLRVAIEGASLLKLSPVLGIGRGCFVDLFPLVDSDPGPIAFTHLESTPLAFVVEWGLAGLVLVLGIGVWCWRSFRANPSVSRRLGLCGLLALGIQSGADFSLDYLGVAAPAVALAGALGPSARKRSWSGKSVLAATLAGLLLAELVAVLAIPDSWSLRRARDLALLAGEGSAAEALASTPLDPFVHLALAREYASAGEWAAAQQRAEVAARLRPASIDAHLLAALAAAELDAPLEQLEHLRRGLEAVREPVPEALPTWLLAHVPAEQLASIAPAGAEAWTALARALATKSPTHARALASARVRTHPEEPEPLRLSAELALAEKNFGLALHHARLLVQVQPNSANALRLRARARWGLASAEQLEVAVAELEAARQSSRLDDPALVDELLILALLRVGESSAFDRAEQLLDGLLARRAKPEVRRRRAALAERVRAREGAR